MEQQNPAPTPTSNPPPATAAAVTTAATTSQPAELSPAQPPPQPAPSTPLPPSGTSASVTHPIHTSTPTPNPNPNPSPRPSTQLTQPQSQSATARPHTLHRPWQHPHPHAHYQHFSTNPSSSPSTPQTSSGPSLSSSSASPSISAPQQKGGVAIGVPAPHPSPYSSSFGQQFGGLSRSTVTVPESLGNTSSSQVRQGMQGIQGVGMMGSMSSISQMRSSGIPAHPQQRPVQSSLRPSSSSLSSQSPTTQNFQGQSFMRSSSVGPSGTPAPNTSQSLQSPNQPWLSSGSQGKPPLPSPSYRPQMGSPSLQQRSHIPQQHHSVSTTSQQQHMPSTQPQQSLPSHQPQEHYGQHYAPPRSITQQLARGQVSATPKPSSLPVPTIHPNTMQQVIQNKTASAESDEFSHRILNKRSIHELVSQVDSSEKLDPEVEEILADIADDFVESITTFGCSLAKHRNSDTLEAKDILLHLERNWNMTVPGFSGDEIKTYKKPLVNDIHKERLVAIRKSISTPEMANVRNPIGQAGGGVKSNLTKTPANTMVSPGLKTREVT